MNKSKSMPFSVRILNERGFYEVEDGIFKKVRQIEEKREKIKNQKKEKQFDVFLKICEIELGVMPVSEYRFTNERRYRLDYAFPDLKIGIEIDGGIWARGNSGHSSGTGIKRDQEKASLLASLGWLLIRVTPNEVLNSKTIELIKKTIENNNGNKVQI